MSNEFCQSGDASEGGTPTDPASYNPNDVAFTPDHDDDNTAAAASQWPNGDQDPQLVTDSSDSGLPRYKDPFTESGTPAVPPGNGSDLDQFVRDGDHLLS